MRISKGVQKWASQIAIIVVSTAILTYLIINFIYKNDDSSAKDFETDRLSNTDPNFAVIVMADRTSSFDDITINNKIQYARKHGYDLIWDFKPSTGYAKVWDKLNNTIFAAQSKKYDWIWAIDFDALITNTSITLESVVEKSLALSNNSDSVEIIFTRDCEPVNLGSVIFRSSPWVVSFIRSWRNHYGTICPQRGIEPLCNEQEILRDMMAINAENVNGRSVVVSQNWLDSYPKELDQCIEPGGRVWESGDFVVHFAGARWWLGEKMEDPVGVLMRKYAPFVV